MSARKQMDDILVALEAEAVMHSMRSMVLSRKAAKLELLVEGMSEERLQTCLDKLVGEGFVKIVDGRAQVVEQDAGEKFAVSSSGGKA